MGLYRIRPWRGRAKRAWDPWRDMDELRQAMEQVAEQAAAPEPAPETGAFAPDVDLYDAGAVLVVRVDLPGMKPADLTVAIEDAVLKIEGDRVPERSGEEAYLRCERPTGRFVRMLQLPRGTDVGLAKATLGDGVLEIILPKGKERSLERIVVRIDVVSRAVQLADVVTRGTA